MHFHPSGVIAESVPNGTLSGIEKGGARISQRPKPLLERLGWPDVVAIEADVFPAERGNVGKQFIGQRFAFGAKLGNGVSEVDGVPEDDGGDREVKAIGTVALVFEGAVPDLAVAMEKQGAGERVPGLALVEAGVGTAPEAGSEIQSRMKRVRSKQPISRSALAKAFCRG